MHSCSCALCLVAGLEWAAQRSRQVRVLVYDASGNFVTEGGATQALVQFCTHATAMQEVLTHSRHDHFRTYTIQAIEGMASAVTAQLAASVLQLHTLKCQYGKLHSFPLMLNLKHLVLEVRRRSLQDGIGALTALRLLEPANARTLLIILLAAPFRN